MPLKKKALLLLSGGFDSPVAAYLMQKKGFEVIAIHFSNNMFTDSEPENKCKVLAEKLGIKKLFVIDLSEALLKISKECEHRHYFVLMKRLFYRIAEKIAEKEACPYLLTGENLGQVSSQTLDNLIVLDKSVKIEILRPLLGFDKKEIIAIAREIGTYETSKGPEHCDILGPEHPSTSVDLKKIEDEEKKLDMGKIVEKYVKMAIPNGQHPIVG